MLTERFQDALAFAADLHSAQTRKSTGIPYVSHLLGVCSIVLEAGGDETCAIAALLHDAIEDQDVTADELAGRFGPDVASVVVECTDVGEHSAATSSARKLAAIAKVPHLSERALLVFAADKLHNARSILADLAVQGDALWSRFNVGRDEQLRYYRALADALEPRLRERDERLRAALADAVARLEAAATAR